MQSVATIKQDGTVAALIAVLDARTDEDFAIAGRARIGRCLLIQYAHTRSPRTSSHAINLQAQSVLNDQCPIYRSHGTSSFPFVS